METERKRGGGWEIESERERKKKETTIEEGMDQF